MAEDESEFQRVNTKIEQLESQLLEQDHRLMRVLYNFFVIRPTLNSKDPKRLAIAKSLIWRFFSARTVAGVGFSLVAVLGVILAYHANVLLKSQNKKLDIQNHLSESNRRASLIFELTSINESIELLPKDENDEVELPASTIGRIVALSRSLKPYHYLMPPSTESDEKKDKSFSVSNIFDVFKERSSLEVTKVPLSPERGQLLITLLNTKISNFNQLIEAGIDFSSADLSNTSLVGADFSNLKLDYADFSGADLQGAIFNGTDLSFSNFNGANLYFSKFISKTEDSSQTWLEGTSFVNADLSSAEFSLDTILRNTDFSFANLVKVKMNPPMLNGAIFYKTIVCEFGVNPLRSLQASNCDNWLNNLKKQYSKKSDALLFHSFANKNNIVTSKGKKLNKIQNEYMLPLDLEKKYLVINMSKTKTD